MDSILMTEQINDFRHLGFGSDLRTIVVSKIKPGLSKVAPEVAVLAAVQELESLIGYDKLDIEFSVDEANQVHIFQVRPIAVNHDSYDLDNEEIRVEIEANVRLFERLQKPPPQIAGNRTLFANMSDWNPAEMIGARPKPLALSLYRHLIGDEVWARQRVEFGYRDSRPHP